jgi:predicted RNA-binding Zn ribbon-like protein
LLVMRVQPAPREPQPGQRRPAPGSLALVQSFVNSRWDLSRDLEEQWGSPDDLAAWLEGHGLLEPGVKLRPADLRRALDIREGLRALLFANNGAPVDQGAIDALHRATDRIALGVDFEPGGPGLVARGRDLDGALAAIASGVAAARIDGTWTRLKACRGRQCGWAFYDHSRNRSGHWCSMAACGQRSKAREYRRRRASPGSLQPGLAGPD